MPNRQNKYIKKMYILLVLLTYVYHDVCSENVKFTQVGLNVLTTGTKSKLNHYTLVSVGVARFFEMGKQSHFCPSQKL